MFKQKLKEILELVLEAAEKTDTYVSFHYGNISKALAVVIGKEVFTIQNDEHLERNTAEIKQELMKLIK